MGNSSNKKKMNNFIIQGGILALAGVLVRILGVFRRIPLAYIIGDIGNGYYSSAYEIYSLVLTISAYGIPLSVSKMVSARIHKGEYSNAQKVFKCALLFATIVGTLSSVLVFIFSKNLSSLMNSNMSFLALRLLAPTLFIVALSGVFRGYFQGTGSMVPTALSQLIEQVVLIVVSLGGASVLTKKGEAIGVLRQNESMKYAYGAAGATLGCTIGALAGLIFLVLLFLSYNKRMKEKYLSELFDTKNESTSHVFIRLLLTIVPVIISNVVNNVSNFLDNFLYGAISVSKGMTEEMRSSFWGIYSGKYIVLINVPIAIAAAMSASSVPTIAALIKKKNYGEVRKKIYEVIRVTMMISIPCAIGMAAISPSIVYLLFSTTDPVAPTLIRIGALGVILFSLSSLSTGILQGLSKLYLPIINGIIALGIHVLILWGLLKGTDLNIYAVALSNNIFSLILCILNVRAISVKIHYKVEYRKTFISPLVCSGVMGIVLFLLDKILMRNGYSKIITIIEILLGAFIYFFALLFTKTITLKELNKLPGGTIVIKLLRKMHINVNQ